MRRYGETSKIFVRRNSLTGLCSRIGHQKKFRCSLHPRRNRPLFEVCAIATGYGIVDGRGTRYPQALKHGIAGRGLERTQNWDCEGREVSFRPRCSRKRSPPLSWLGSNFSVSRCSECDRRCSRLWRSARGDALQRVNRQGVGSTAILLVQAAKARAKRDRFASRT